MVPKTKRIHALQINLVITCVHVPRDQPHTIAISLLVIECTRHSVKRDSLWKEFTFLCVTCTIIFNAFSAIKEALVDLWSCDQKMAVQAPRLLRFGMEEPWSLAKLILKAMYVEWAKLSRNKLCAIAITLAHDCAERTFLQFGQLFTLSSAELLQV